jgi:hypothetical protein
MKFCLTGFGDKLSLIITVGDWKFSKAPSPSINLKSVPPFIIAAYGSSKTYRTMQAISVWSIQPGSLVFHKLPSGKQTFARTQCYLNARFKEAEMAFSGNYVCPAINR